MSGDPQPMRVGGRRVELQRYPATRGELRAWDAADVLLLEQHGPLGDGPVLVLDERHGALAVGVGRDDVVAVCDSYCARVALRDNLVRNGRSPASVQAVAPGEALPPNCSAVLFRPPRDLGRFEHVASLVAAAVPDGTPWYGAAMDRWLPTRVLELLGQLVGPTTRHRAVGRARRIDAVRDRAVAPDRPPRSCRHRLPDSGVDLVAPPGVFGARRLDPGTEALLGNLPAPGARRIADLGSGTGVLAVVLGRRDPDAQLLCVDDSHLAVSATRANLTSSLGEPLRWRVVHGNGLFDWGPDEVPCQPGSLDLVVSNPPFHDDHALDDATAWRLLSDARRGLRPGGELRVVGHRRLAHHAKLRRLFGNCEVLWSDARYVVLRAERSGSPAA